MVLAFVTVMARAGAPLVSADCPDCGPDFCLNDQRYPAKLASKKDAMAKERYPRDLIALMDKDGACVARVERAPDGFSIMTVAGDAKTTAAWTSAGEADAKARLIAHELDAYYKFNASQAMPCCKEPKPEARKDWNAKLGLSMNQVISCTLQGDGVVCK